MVTRVVDAALASTVESTLVVTGHEPERVADTLGERAVGVVHNPDFEQGLSTSLRVGLAALPAEIDGAVVLLGDMPRVTAEHIDRLIAAFDPLEGRAICVPTYDGKRGNPVLFAAEFFAEMRSVAGDVGARHLIGQHEDQVAEVAMDDDAIFLDIDTPEALTAIGGDAA
jgi:molybdenum cofactor cytidylyltransferase